MNVDEKTKVSLFAVIMALPFIAGGILWLTSIDSKAAEAKTEIQGLKEIVLDIRERLVRIEDHEMAR